MKSSLWKFLSVALVAVLLSACVAKEAPSCTNEAVLATAKELVWKTLPTAQYKGVSREDMDATLAVYNANLVGSSPKPARNICKAQMTLRISDQLLQVFFPAGENAGISPELNLRFENHCTDDVCAEELQFEVQLVDGEPTVSVALPKPFIRLIDANLRAISASR